MAYMRMHKTNLLLLATSIGLHFCKLLSSSLDICVNLLPIKQIKKFT